MRPPLAQNPPPSQLADKSQLGSIKGPQTPSKKRACNQQIRPHSSKNSNSILYSHGNQQLHLHLDSKMASLQSSNLRAQVTKNKPFQHFFLVTCICAFALRSMYYGLRQLHAPFSEEVYKPLVPYNKFRVLLRIYVNKVRIFSTFAAYIIFSIEKRWLKWLGGGKCRPVWAEP